MTLPVVRSHLLEALQGINELYEQVEPYRCVLPGWIIWGLREARSRTNGALACLDGLDDKLAATLSVPPPASGSTQGLG
jgi:hypothetical protein